MATTFIIVFDVILKISFELFQHQAKLLVDSYSSGLFNYYIKIIVLNTSFLIIKHLVQGCQLPDFSLRSQTFCYTADFSTTFLYMLKTKTFFFIFYSITKPPASTLKLKILDFILQKLSVTPDKNWESAPTQLVSPVPGQALACGNAYVEHFAKFLDFFETQCWQL